MSSSNSLTSLIKTWVRRFREPSLFRWLFLTLALTIGSAQIVMFGVIFFGEYRRTEASLREMLRERAEFVLSKNEDMRISANYSSLSRLLYEIKGVESVAIFDRNCNVLASQPINSDAAAICRNRKTQGTWSHVEFKDSYSALSSVALKQSGILLPEVLSAFYSSYGIFILYSCALALISIFWIRRYFFRQLTAVTESIEQLSINTVGRPTLDHYPLELRPVYTTLFTTRERLAEATIRLQTQAKLEALHVIASQVSHDIRSPLAAINMLVGRLTALPETERLMLRQATNRIRDISNNLLDSHKRAPEVAELADTSASTSDPSHSLSPTCSGQTTSTPFSQSAIREQPLSVMIDAVVSEKRAVLYDRPEVQIHFEILPSAYAACATIDAIEFKRVVSNLLNNAIEATPPGAGPISVHIVPSAEFVSIRIQDNGKGMPPEVIAKLGQRGFSHGKQAQRESGSGLGVHHARQSVESWGGRLSYESELGKGTSAIIDLPRSPPPTWFAEEVVIPTRGQVVILDDDLFIHRTWDLRFEDLELSSRGISVVRFYSGAELESWLNTIGGAQPGMLFLCDLELQAEKRTGLQIIESHRLQDFAFLVTGRFDDGDIQAECERIRVRMVPKTLAAYVPIKGP